MKNNDVNKGRRMGYGKDEPCPGLLNDMTGSFIKNEKSTILSNSLILPVLSNSTKSKFLDKLVLRMTKCFFYKQCQLDPVSL